MHDICRFGEYDPLNMLDYYVITLDSIKTSTSKIRDDNATGACLAGEGMGREIFLLLL